MNNSLLIRSVIAMPLMIVSCLWSQERESGAAVSVEQGAERETCKCGEDRQRWEQALQSDDPVFLLRGSYLKDVSIMDPNDAPVALSKDAEQKQLKTEDRVKILDILKRCKPVEGRILAGFIPQPDFQLKLGGGYLINGKVYGGDHGVVLSWINCSREDRAALTTLLKPYLQEMGIWN